MFTQGKSNTNTRREIGPFDLTRQLDAIKQDQVNTPEISDKRVSCVWSKSKLALQVLLLLQLYFLRGGGKFLPKKNCFFYMSTGNASKQ